MSNFYYLGSNVSLDLLKIINQQKNVQLLFHEDEINSPDHYGVQGAIKSMVENKHAIQIDFQAIKSTERRFNDFKGLSFETILESVLNDYNSNLLLTKDIRVDFGGAFKNHCLITDIIYFALNIYVENKPKKLICLYTPHTVVSWIVARVFEELGVKVIRLIQSVVPWIFRPIEGLKHIKDCNLRTKRGNFNQEILSKYLLNLREEYVNAVPWYEKVKPSKNYLKRMIGFLNPKNQLKTLEKHLTKKEFLKYADKVNEYENYCVYFLHYQPEGNTFPEAGVFGDQFNAIRKLSESLPSDMKLVIKEHPSTFSKRCDRRWRPDGFYKRILSIPNICLCALDFPTFKIIDEAEFVASITGICLIEALARGVKPITFSATNFHGFDNNLIINANVLNTKELREAINSSLETNNKITNEEIINSFRNIVEYGYDASKEVINVPIKSREEQLHISRMNNMYFLKDAIDGQFD